MNGDATDSASNLGRNPSKKPTASSTVNPNSSRAQLRTFIAIDLPSPLVRALASTQERLQAYLRAPSVDEREDRRHNGALRWSPAKNLHLTLRFLGDTTPRQLEQMTARLQEVVAKVTPFQLQVDDARRGLGGFPNLRRPRVLWSGVGGNLEALGRLQAQVEAIAQAVGFAPEEKSYSPHLTLARAAREADKHTLTDVGQRIGDFMRQAEEAAPLPFWVDRLIFYHSELGAGGAHYTVLAELPFAGD